jgi:hypothetical protein
MASIINIIRPFSVIYTDSSDDILYENSKLLLRDMADLGNMTSRGHFHLMKDLEGIREPVIGRVHSSVAERLMLSDGDINIDEWLAMMNASPSADIVQT